MRFMDILLYFITCNVVLKLVRGCRDAVSMLCNTK